MAMLFAGGLTWTCGGELSAAESVLLARDESGGTLTTAEAISAPKCAASVSPAEICERVRIADPSCSLAAFPGAGGQRLYD